MKKTGKCPKCGSRRVLFIDQMSQSTDGLPAPLHLCAVTSPIYSAAGGLQSVVCCVCGYLEWYARELQNVIDHLGDFAEIARVQDGDFEDAVESLGLARAPTPMAGGWQFFAQGTYDGIPLTIGQRPRARMVEGRLKTVVRIEVLATASSNLGGYIVRKRTAVGLEPNVPHRQVVKKGDAEFDAMFGIVLTGSMEGQLEWYPQDGSLPLVRIPWFDGTVRGHLMTAPPEELFANGNSVGMLLLDYRSEAFIHAVELAVHLAKWRAPQMHPFR